MRKRKASGTTTCTCGRPRRPNQRDCDQCHAKAQREYRKRQKEKLNKLQAFYDQKGSNQTQNAPETFSQEDG
jgi:uncharacterized OB-fold protein